MTSLITISTRELAVEDPTINPSDFVVNFATPIDLGSLGYEVCLYSFRGWNTVRNITTAKSISYSVDGNPFTLAVPPGLYGVEDINTMLQTDIVANGGLSDELQILPNFNTNRVDIRIDNSSHTYTIDLTSSDNLSQFLGFTPAVLNSTTSGDALPNVNGGVDSFQIECDLIRNSYSNGRVGKILYSFTPAYSPSGQIVIEPTHLAFFQINKSVINSIRFKLVDNLGEILNFSGENVVIQLMLRKIT